MPPPTPSRLPDRLPRTSLVAVALACAAAAQAQGLRITPSLNAEASFLETRGRTIGSNGREAVLSVGPGISLTSATGRLRGTLDYSGNLIYRRGRADTAGNEWQNALSASFLAEAVPDWAFVETRASISQQSISAFGQQSAPGSLQFNANRTEVASLTVTPYVRGSLRGWADYEVRLQGTLTDSRDPAAADSRSGIASVTLSSPSRGAVVGWSVTASQQRNEIDTAPDRPLDNHRINAAVTVTPAPELRFQLGGGRESVDDGTTAERRVFNNANLGAVWTPSVRTSLWLDLGERYFGRSKRVSFSHRAPRTVWSYSFSRDVQTGADSLLFGAPTTLFDLYFEQAASVVPDPAARRQFVLTQLAALGLDPNETFVPAFQTSSYSLVRRQDLAFGWFGVRTTLTVNAYTTSQSSILSIGGGDPVLGEPTRLHGYSSTVSYKLTPLTSLVFGGQRAMTFATSTQGATDLKSANAGLTSQLGPRTTASLSARYSVFNSTIDPYRETSVTATLGLRF